MIMISVSYGELVDKLTILQIKKEKIKSKRLLIDVKKEYENLNEKYKGLYVIIKHEKKVDLEPLYDELYEINKKLWKIEDAIREKERNNTFDHTFVNLARKVYHINDERFRVKSKINALGSDIKEVKSYKKY